MAIGHSEGTITVAGLSAKFAAITHTVLLSGGGPTQLFDLAELARKTSNSKNLVEAQKEVDEVFLQWEKISKDPDSVEKFAWGHPFKRWSSFMATSTLDQLLISKAEVFLINGTEDESVPIEAFDILRAELLRHRRSFKFKVIPGANHGLDMPGEGKGTDRERAFKEAVE